MKNAKKSAIFALATVFIWASAFPITKYATAALPPNALGLVRCSIAAVILLIIGAIKHIKAPKIAHVPLFLLCGGFGFTLYMICFNTGMQTLSSAASSLIIATAPVLTAIGAALIYRERIKALGWAAILTAFLGVGVLLAGDIAASGLQGGTGIFWTAAAAFVFCCYNLLNRKLLSLGYTAIECVTWSMVCGALLLLFFLPDAIGALREAPATAVAATVYLGVMPSAVAYLLWSFAMSFARKTSDVTNFQFLTPLFSTVLGFAILGEVPGIFTVIGGLVILGSVVLFGLKGKTQGNKPS